MPSVCCYGVSFSMAHRPIPHPHACSSHLTLGCGPAWGHAQVVTISTVRAQQGTMSTRGTRSMRCCQVFLVLDLYEGY